MNTSLKRSRDETSSPLLLRRVMSRSILVFPWGGCHDCKKLAYGLFAPVLYVSSFYDLKTKEPFIFSSIKVSIARKKVGIPTFQIPQQILLFAPYVHGLYKYIRKREGRSFELFPVVELADVFEHLHEIAG